MDPKSADGHPLVLCGTMGRTPATLSKARGGPFYCSVYLTDGRRHVRSLGTTDSTGALRLVAHQMTRRTDQTQKTVTTVSHCVLV
jgi:hypothetical protein